MRIDALLWLVCLLCLGSLDEVLAQQPHADFQFRSLQQNSSYPEDQYRWRPLNGDMEYSGLTDQAFQGQGKDEPGYFSSVTDYADTPSGLPRGVYRPVQERHNITPHKEGFRFRTLTPSEQLRVKRRNQENRQSPNRVEKNRSEKAPLNPYGAYTDANNREGFRFRPDKRLDKKGRGSGRREDHTFPYDPAFTGTYPAPIFRQD
ncbi:MAG: hypothetical protein KZQ78_11260 [Candidatus Thiodiazotropha sp. (ex Ustalcina ferruginea)]|nr:hypothetical protein [Candidatus Thiodiazotropha sp. (ex Ustalcina ferruginea)]